MPTLPNFSHHAVPLPMPRLPRAVLLDFDGVLADTENVHVVAWERTFSTLGWTLPPDEAARAAEVDDRVFLVELFTKRELDPGMLDVEAWVRRKQTVAVALLRESPRLYPGVAELVETLRGKTKLAVVTTTWRENVDAVLDGTGLSDAFQLFIGKEDVRAVKPDPEPYKLALKRLRVAAGSAVALEDSPTGIDSAVACGVRTLAIGHRRPQGEWCRECAFLPGFDDLDSVLDHLSVPETGRRS